MREGEHLAVCLSDTDSIIGDLFAIKEEPDTYSVWWNFNLKYGIYIVHEQSRWNSELLKYIPIYRSEKRVDGILR